MLRIFAKTIQNYKVCKTYKYINEQPFEIGHFDSYIKDICEHFDSPSPIVLPKHIRDFIIFSTTTFTKDDFIEKIHFDKLVIEVDR